VEEIVKILTAKQVRRPIQTVYASGVDFCRIFENNMNRLYTLSLLLTGDHELAEKCFVGGLDDSKRSNLVFKEWAESWARRMIITNAVRMVGPRSQHGAVNDSDEAVGPPITNVSSEVVSVMRLRAFERFVFVISVLEGYSERDCSLLLHCSGRDVADARLRALQQIAVSGEVRDKLREISNGQQQSANSESAFSARVFPQLAASA
jgi:hypothetical protein